MFKAAFTRAIYLIVMFLANLLLANLLMPSYFGTLTLMILNASVFTIFTGLGTDSIILHSLANKKWNIGQALTFTRNALSIQIILFILCEVISIRIFTRTFLTQNGLVFLIPETAFFLGLILTDKLIILFYNSQKALTANILLFISAIIFFTFLFYFKYFNIRDPKVLFLIFSLQSFFQGLILLVVYVIKNKDPFEKIINASVAEAFKLSFIVMATNVIQFFAYRIDYYFLQQFHSEREVGVYAQSNKMANLMWIIPNIFALLLIPKFGQLSSINYPSIFRLAFIKNIALVVLTSLTGYLGFTYILSPEYADGLYAFYYMLPGYFCWATVIYFGAYFSYSGKFHYNLIASSFCLSIIFIADFVLIPTYGIKGAAVSNSISYSATLLLYLFIYTKSNKINFFSLFQFEKGEWHLIINSLK